MNRRGYITIAILVLAAATAVALVLVLHRPSSAPGGRSSAKYVIALDAGHGGKDPGGVVGDLLEKNVNLAIVKRVQAQMESDPKMRPYVTRTVDVYIPLEERIRRAEEAKASIYLTIHVNSFDLPEVVGMETWVDSTRKDADPSWVLASMVLESISAATGGRNRGVRSQELYLQRTKMPAIAVEVGYITNPNERALLADPVYQDKIALGILNGLHKFIAYLEEEQAPVGPASSSAAKATSTSKKP
ncbi:MAG: N-acetylmuramoyl-L-alanine amidase [Candidatus Bipolaricaulis sp.]|nr:N-acetylmuramoyl-L-alanine amidase [Candidatus Bipolaricaulis sp.]